MISLASFAGAVCLMIVIAEKADLPYTRLKDYSRWQYVAGGVIALLLLLALMFAFDSSWDFGWYSFLWLFLALIPALTLAELINDPSELLTHFLPDPDEAKAKKAKRRADHPRLYLFFDKIRVFLAVKLFLIVSGLSLWHGGIDALTTWIYTLCGILAFHFFVPPLVIKLLRKVFHHGRAASPTTDNS